MKGEIITDEEYKKYYKNAFAFIDALDAAEKNKDQKCKKKNEKKNHAK